MHPLHTIELGLCAKKLLILSQQSILALKILPQMRAERLAGVQEGGYCVVREDTWSDLTENVFRRQK